ncbi:uncharacterized protein LOC130590259 [Beta vulgaris subsp. vulgaris]|uniref:uncharacterized protein LOC130590259 n=1 Tax=Beta vulgaris subsp. vulgaris TaxID=3555 RepID=UPI00254815AA|nr:uncharacterized protein LOC130590259 [Beta vulgaris subsp. vulgaris]
MRCTWEELESLNNLPPLTSMTTEINEFIQALNLQQEEHKLFQFLNGLDESYDVQRSQILMMTPLPSVEVACSYLDQEEAQREILGKIKEEHNTLTMYSKGTGGESGSNYTSLQCTVCGKSGHTQDKCWFVIGFPTKNPKQKNQAGSSSQYKGKGKSNMNQKWNKWKPGGGGVKVAVNVQGNQAHNDNTASRSNATTITAQKLEQLLSLLPTPSKGCDIDEEMDVSYSGMVSCYYADSMKNGEWIVDSGASNHMTGRLELLSSACASKERNCKAVFCDKYCLTQDCNTDEVIGVARGEHGLYYLLNEEIGKILMNIKNETLQKKEYI